MRSGSENSAGFTIGYDLGTVGTWVRIAIGVVASLALLVIDLTDVDMRFLVDTAIWFMVILGVYTVVFALLAPRVLPLLNPWVSAVIFYGPVLVLPYIDALPDTFRVALALYVSLSVLVVVVVRYGGCEVVGIPSLILRRRFAIYCPWNTVDLVDKAIEDSKWSSLLQGPTPKVIGVLLPIAILTVGVSSLGDAFPLVWLGVALGSVLVIAIAVAIRRSSTPTPGSSNH